MIDGRGRLEEFKLLMRRLDLAAHEKGFLQQEMSDLHCRKAFDIAASSLGLPTMTPKGRPGIQSEQSGLPISESILRRFVLVQNRFSSVPIRCLTTPLKR